MTTVIPGDTPVTVPEPTTPLDSDATPAAKTTRPVKKKAPRKGHTPTTAPTAVVKATPEVEQKDDATESPAASDLEPFTPVEEKPLTVTQEFRAFIEPAPTADVPASAPVELSELATLEARSISAWFGDRKVLDRVDLTMEAGKVTALIGPSGCGKSTFLRILNRMHEMIPSASLAGEVLLDGEDIYSANRRLTAARREIGMVFQKPNPFPAMSIYDNVIAGLKLTGTRASRDEKDLLVESSLTKAGLWKEVRDRLRQPGGGLSGGQQQRLCIARSLAVRPRVLLMDEPCSALDPTSTRVIEETMLELAHEVTIVIVTHNMQQAQRVSDNCAFFLAAQGTPGAIVEQGDTKVLFESPIDPRTHDYVNGRFG
ncbi:phosphate transport system ATP-binding protein [Leifsonia sp. AK011]|nr:phosphate transport system ATP-binding protein [Leifsonia sp. AK011]